MIDEPCIEGFNIGVSPGFIRLKQARWVLLSADTNVFIWEREFLGQTLIKAFSFFRHELRLVGNVLLHIKLKVLLSD